jgi:hypothetical protein
MAVALQVVAGEGVEDATAQEGGADQDVENVKHCDFPRTATEPPHAAGMLRCTQISRRAI